MLQNMLVRCFSHLGWELCCDHCGCRQSLHGGQRTAVRNGYKTRRHALHMTCLHCGQVSRCWSSVVIMQGNPMKVRAPSCTILHPELILDGTARCSTPQDHNQVFLWHVEELLQADHGWTCCFTCLCDKDSGALILRHVQAKYCCGL